MAATPAADSLAARGTLVIVAQDGLPGFGDWAEQLIAESTGKLGRGVLPVAAGPDAPELTTGAPDVLVARVTAGSQQAGSSAGVSVTGPDQHERALEVTVTGPLGAQFLLWEYATAVAGHILGINPFDQPDVESAKVAARGLLDATPEPVAPAFAADGVAVTGSTPSSSPVEPVAPAFAADGVAVTGSTGLLEGVEPTLQAALAATLGRLSPSGYVAVMAYLDRLANAPLAGVRDRLAARTGRPVTFGWGPRFLHSTGQFHKGGPAVGVFIQVVAGPGFVEDLHIPDRPFSYGRLIAAQAAGDATVLASHDVPVLTFTVSSDAGLRAVKSALDGAR